MPVPKPFPRGLRLGALLAATALALLLPEAPARACDLCAIYTGTVLQEEKTGAWVGLAEQYTDFDTIRTDGRKAANPAGEWVHSSVTQLLVGYAFTEWLGVQANVPLISREYRRVEHSGVVRGDASGLGDLSLLARLSPFNGSVGNALVHVEVLAGIKIPTGNSDRLAEELPSAGEGEAHASARPHHEEEEGHDGSAVHGHDLALGTGSVDGVFGAAFYGSWKRVILSASLQGVVRGRGDFGYRYAHDLIWETGPGLFVLVDDAYTAAVQLVARGEYKGNDRLQGTVADDTAMTAVYVGPGISATWRDALQARLALDLPTLQENSATQIVADYRFRGGIIWRF